MSTHTIGRPPVYPSPPERMARLPLRDELYLIAHDDAGSPHIHSRSLAAGLAGAILIDLTRNGRVGIRDGRIVVQSHDPIGDLITDAALASIRTTRSAPTVAGWLRGSAEGGLHQRARANLVTVGILGHTARRMRADVYPPVDTAWAVRARGMIRSVVVYGTEQPDAQCAALCGLLAALGLHTHLFLDGPPHQTRAVLRTVASGHHPPVRHIITAVEHVVGDLATAAYG